VAVVPVIFYTFIAGLGVAAVRSTIMMLSFLLALLRETWCPDEGEKAPAAAYLRLEEVTGRLAGIPFRKSSPDNLSETKSAGPGKEKSTTCRRSVPVACEAGKGVEWLKQLPLTSLIIFSIFRPEG
jgi:hypothetical protein